MRFRKPVEVLIMIATIYLSIKMFIAPEGIGGLILIVVIINISLLEAFGNITKKLSNKLDTKLSKYVVLR